MRSRKTILIGFMVFLLLAVLFNHECWSEREYRIGPSDLLLVRVWGNEDLTREVVVSPDGRFRFPLIGEVTAAGRTVDELGRILSERLADGYLVNPHVEVMIKEYRSQKVYVLGEVLRPGTYPLDSRASVIEIISEAGGLGTEAGDVAEIVRARNDWRQDKPLTPDHEAVSEVIRIDLRGLLAGKGGSEDVEIQNGDTIFVPKAEVFYIFGEVGQPGKYRWEKDLTVLKAVIIAGGFTEIASKRGIKIRRKISEEEKKIRVKLDTPVAPGDMIIVSESFF
jgi:polysaccharide export outer membrane protein